MSTEIITSAAATVGGGFFGGLLFGYAIKKVVKLVAVIAGLFIAGLAFDWNKIEAMADSKSYKKALNSAVDHVGLLLLYPSLPAPKLA